MKPNTVQKAEDSVENDSLYTAMDDNVALGLALRRLAEQRDADAWATVLNIAGSRMYHVANRVLNDREHAEDAVQESLLQIREYAGNFRPGNRDEGAALAWVLRVTTLSAMHLLRQSRCRLKRDRKSAVLQNTDAPSAEMLVARAEMQRIVREELAELPERYRDPVALHYFGGLDYAQLAVQLRLPVNTVKTHVRRALEKLRQRLNRRGCMVPAAELCAALLANAPAAVPSPTFMAACSALLASADKPAAYCAAKLGGISLMAKLSLGAAAAMLCIAIPITALKSQGATSEETASPEAPVAPREGPGQTPPIVKASSGDASKVVAKVTNVTKELLTISAGETSKLLPGYEFTIKHDEKATGTARIESVQRATCIARMVTLHGDSNPGVQVGDAAEMEIQPWQATLHASLQETITIDFEKAEFKWTINTIFVLTGVSVTLTQPAEDTAAAVTLHAEQLPLVDFLDVITKNNGLSWRVQNRTVVIDVDPNAKDTATPAKAKDPNATSSDEF
jgi:RNA polymerase sigma-70 factor, ECF subfamily